MKNLIEKIRRAKTWQERHELAENKTPGTVFDTFFREAEFAHSQPGHFLSEEIFRRHGVALAGVISRGEIQSIYDPAAALRIWRRHRRKAKPDDILAALFALSGMFPPGWKKTWGVVRNAKTAQIARIAPSPPASVRETIGMRDIEMNVRARIRARDYPTISEKAWKELWPDLWAPLHKKAQRYVKEFSIKLDQRRGAISKAEKATLSQQESELVSLLKKRAQG